MDGGPADHASALPDADLLLARETLRARQVNLGAAPARSIIDSALAKYDSLNAWTPDPDTGRWRRGPFTYDPQLEAERIARGEAIIRRVDPIDGEDPAYFSILAQHAASIELALASRVEGAPPTRFILGTVPAAIVNAFSQRTATGSYTVIALHAGLVDFIYQAAKALIEAARPRKTKGDEKGLTRIDWSPDTIRKHLDEDDGAANRLYESLEAYYFHGYPRASGPEAVPEIEQPTISILVTTAERFVVAHEYGHALMAAPIKPRDGMSKSWAKEYMADSIGIMLAVHSAADYDALPPDITLSGAAFAMSCLDVLSRSYSLLKVGDEFAMDAIIGSHPPAAARMASLVHFIRSWFEIEYHPDQTYTFWSPPRDSAPPERGLSDERAEMALLAAKSLELVWNRAKVRLEADRASGRAMHPMWA